MIPSDKEMLDAYRRSGRQHHGSEFDMALPKGEVHEALVYHLFKGDVLLLEVKGEDKTYDTDNLCVELRSRGKPSGLAVTTSDFWVVVLAGGYHSDLILGQRTTRLRHLINAWLMRALVLPKGAREPRFEAKVGDPDDDDQVAVLVPLKLVFDVKDVPELPFSSILEGCLTFPETLAEKARLKTDMEAEQARRDGRLF
ncbi:MAG: hypothetical protein Q8R28_15305 [Dehalococcoidia bacterium]|nr:hypothetical protein [Dehalococcoidia bacterium]